MNGPRKRIWPPSPSARPGLPAIWGWSRAWLINFFARLGDGKAVGFANYERMFKDPIFFKAIWNTSYFVLLTVIPGTAARTAASTSSG